MKRVWIKIIVRLLYDKGILLSWQKKDIIVETLVELNQINGVER